MVVPKRRHSSSRQAKRRANWKLKTINVIECPKCHEPILPHYACPSCGTYKDRTVVEIEEKKEKGKEKAQKKEKAKEEKKEKEKKGEKKEKAVKEKGKKKE